jgi:membrane-bound serine protease (ClpP class)
MTSIIDPNLAFVLLVGGFVLSVLALLTPGTGIIEIGGIFALIAAGYGVISNPSNLWAFLLIIPFFPLVLIYRKRKSNYLLILAIILLNVGCYTLFRKEGGGFAVSLVLGICVAVVDAPIIWFIVKRITEALDKAPVFNPSQIVGKIGESRTNIFPEGTVYVDGEEWSARSSQRIEIDRPVRVTAIDGLTLYVEEVIQNQNTEVK